MHEVVAPAPWRREPAADEPAGEARVAGGTAWPARYELLDGLRGLAALAVAASHLLLIDAGHTAVMVFFIISGYCITASAESCRRAGLSFREFMWRRVRRIYPPYLCAVAFYAATRIVKHALGGPNDLARPWTDWVQNLTLTQWVTLPLHPINWPSANPKLFVAAFWSLNYEEQFYLVVALSLLLVMRVRIGLAWPLLALAVAGLAWNLIWPGGWVCGVFIEYWLHFALGAGLFLVLCRYPDRRVRIGFIAVLAALGGLGVSRMNLGATIDTRVFFEYSVVCTVALALLLLRPISAALSRTWLWAPIAGLGAISYSLYLIHQFNLTLVMSAVDLLPVALPSALRGVVMLLLQVALATVFWRFCERPFLNQRLRAP